MRSDGGTATILLAKHHDVATARTIVDDVRSAVDDGARSVVTDMREVVFMDSTAIGALIEAKRYADSHGVDFTLAEVPENTLRLLSLTALDQVFTISSTRAEDDGDDDLDQDD